MKNISFIIFIFLSTSCARNTSVTKTEQLSYLDSIIPYMEGFAKDTATFYDKRFNNNGSIISIVGKFIDSKKVYALDVLEKDTLINFYHFNKNKWQLLGSGRITFGTTFNIEFEDMNGNGLNEIIVFSPSNMNGNSCQDVYSYSEVIDSIHYVGSFPTDFEIDKKNKTVRVSYEGSWYAPFIKTLYKWQNEKLIRVKEIELALVNSDIRNDERIFRYYENPNTNQDSLILKIEAPYKKEKYKKLWDNFFENN